MRKPDHLSIGALSRASGVSAATLRNWEKRYGFPAPMRLESGHRRYPISVLARLRLIQRALENGMRPATVVPAEEGELHSLLGQVQPNGELGIWLDAVGRVDTEALERGFRQAWTRHGVRGFVFEVAVPFMHEVGERWSRADLVVMHEHFASELLRGFLGVQLSALNHLASGPRVVCATLSGELHSLGLQMAAVLLAAANLRVVFLGASTPYDQIAQAATHGEVAAVLIGSSSAAEPAGVATALCALRAELPDGVELAVGGNDAEVPTGVTRFPTLAAAAAWAESVA